MTQEELQVIRDAHERDYQAKGLFLDTWRLSSVDDLLEHRTQLLRHIQILEEALEKLVLASVDLVERGSLLSRLLERKGRPQ